jgi:hypothetical protein
MSASDAKKCAAAARELDTLVHHAHRCGREQVDKALQAVLPWRFCALSSEHLRKPIGAAHRAPRGCVLCVCALMPMQWRVSLVVSTMKKRYSDFCSIGLRRVL